MIGNKLVSRLALACGVSFAAMTAAPAVAQSDVRQESAIYMLRYAQEIADGTQVISQSKDMMVARRRTGDRSMMVIDTQNGAVTVERADGSLVYPLLSKTGPETSYAFDYGKLYSEGSGFASIAFNGFVKPLVAASPAPGKDARWSIETNLKAMGLPDAPDAKTKINLSRTYLQVGGKPVVLIEYDIPAFTYASNGDSVVHWARGMAVTDPGFGEIHAYATQHRASVREADGDMRPVSVRTTMNGIDRTGGWRMSFAGAKQIEAAMARVIEVQGDAVHPTGSAEDAAHANALPVLVASRLDTLAFGVAENSPNSITQAADTGQQVNPAPLPPATQADVDAYNRMMSDSATMFGGTPPPPMTLEEFNQMRINVMNSLNGLDFGNVLTQQQIDDAAKQQQLQDLMAQLQNVYGLMDKMLKDISSNTPDGISSMPGLSPPGMFGGAPPSVDQYNQTMADMAATFGGPAPKPLTAQEYQQMLDNYRTVFSKHDGPPNAEELATLTNQLDGQFQQMLGMLQGMLQDVSSSVGGEAITADQLDELVSQIAREAELRDATEAQTKAFDLINDIIKQYDLNAESVIDGLRGELPPEQYEALLERLAQPNDPRLQDAAVTGFVEMPGWIEPNSADAEEYRRLIEELETEMAAVRAALEKQTAEERVREFQDAWDYGDDENFYQNNAFDYTSMVGIIPTDLSRWAAWLTTQNVRELERLALTIGYPNLASALADAENIIRQSQDTGYRQWAMQAPSCGGYVGCGPNYLERWHAKQSVVALGDILADSRGIFSSGGFSDIGISGLNLAYLLRDHALQDGDIVQIRITQFGRVIYEGQVNLTNAGEIFNLMVGRGVASLEIFAVNEGSASPNTAQITVENVVRGQATQTYSLQTGQTATLRIEAGAKPAPSSGTSGAGQ